MLEVTANGISARFVQTKNLSDIHLQLNNFKLHTFLIVFLSYAGLPVLATTHITAIQLNNDGIHALDKRQWIQAIDKLTESLLIDPDYALARENLATAHNNYALILRTRNEHESFREFHYAVFFEQKGGPPTINLNGMTGIMGWNSQKYEDRVELGDRFLKEGDIVSAYIEYNTASRLKGNDLGTTKTLSAKLQKLTNLWDTRSDLSLDSLRTLAVSTKGKLLDLDSRVLEQNVFMVVLKLEERGDWDRALKLLQTYDKATHRETSWVVLLNHSRRMKNYKEAEALLNESGQRVKNNPTKMRLVLDTLMDIQADYGELEALQNSRKLLLSKFPNAKDAAIRRAEIDYYEQDIAKIRKYEAGQSPIFISIPVMPIKVYFGPGKSIAPGSGIYTKSVSQRFARHAKDALTAWALATDNQLTFVLVNKPGDADIKCEWTTDTTTRRHSFTCGQTSCSTEPPHSKVASNIEIYLDPKHLWNDHFFYQVCLHELGHALGLPHSISARDVMFWGEGSEIIREAGKDFVKLSSVDKKRIRAIYSDPLQAKKKAFEFAQAAYVDAEYEKAYQLLSFDEQNKVSLSQFRQQIESAQSNSRPKALQLYSAEIFPAMVKIGLQGTSGGAKSYYYVEVVCKDHRQFEINKPRILN